MTCASCEVGAFQPSSPPQRRPDGCDAAAAPREAHPARPAWQATLWKRSSFLRVWRSRRMCLEGTAGGPWRLTSWADDGDAALPTGIWELGEGEEVTSVEPRFGYCAVLEVQGVVLAADTKDSSEALRELLDLLGSRARRDSEDSPDSFSTAEGQADRQDSAPSLDLQDWPGDREEPQHRPPAGRLEDLLLVQPLPSGPQVGPQGKEGAPSPPSLGPPKCEECSSEPARGQVVGRLQGGVEVRKWLCRQCFVASWTTISENDGRWAERSPRWMLMGRGGALQDATPPPLRRYAAAFPGSCRSLRRAATT